MDLNSTDIAKTVIYLVTFVASYDLCCDFAVKGVLNDLRGVLPK